MASLHPPPLSRSRFFFNGFVSLFSVSTLHDFLPEKVASEGGEGMVQTEHRELSGMVLEDADVVYVTRIQKERFATEEVCPYFLGLRFCVHGVPEKHTARSQKIRTVLLKLLCKRSLE